MPLFFDLYDLHEDLPLPLTATKITQAFGVGCIGLGALYYLLPAIIISTKIFWSGYFIIYILIIIWRACYYYVLKQNIFVQSILVIGTGQLAMDIAREVEERHDSPYQIFAFIGKKEPVYNPREVKVYENLESLHEPLTANKIDRIIVALDDRRGGTPIEQLLNYKLHGIVIEQGVSFYEKLSGKILVEKLDPSAIIFSEGFSISRAQTFGKRFFDIVFSSSLLFFSLPVMIVTALIIKLESPGPIVYSQERVGIGRRCPAQT